MSRVLLRAAAHVLRLSAISAVPVTWLLPSPSAAQVTPAQATPAQVTPAGDSILLPDIVVTASRVPVNAAQVGSAVTVIDREQIERRGDLLVSDLLRDVPGVAVSRSGPTGALTQVRLRGAEANHTLVLIDGIEVNDPGNDSEFNFANLLAADVERIEVLRGPQSALWGSDALGGVVNIITRRGAGAPRLSAAVEGGSFGTGQGRASLLAGGDDYNVALNLASLHSRGISVAPGSERDGYDNATASFRGGYSPSDNIELSAVGRYIRSTVQTDSPDFVTQLPVDSFAEANTEQLFGRAQGKLELFGGAWEHILGVAYTGVDSDFRDDFSETRTIGSKRRYDYQTNVFFDTPGFANATHSFTLLGEREDEEFTYRGFTDVDRDVTNYGVAGEYRLGLFDRVFLSGALRYDDNDIFENATTYRLTGAYRHLETGTRLHASYGKGVKNPTFFELFGFAGTYRGNPDLEPETSKGFDVGVEQRFGDGRYIVDVTYFHQNLDNEIQGFGDTSINLDGESKRRGVEVTATARLLPGLDLSGAYTYLRAREPNGDEEVRRARHSASLQLNYRFLEDRANVNLGVQYNGSREDIDFRQGFAVPPGRVTLDDFWLVNVAASYRLTDGLEVFGRIENVLDENYEEVFGYNTPGVGFFLGLRASLGGDRP